MDKLKSMLENSNMMMGGAHSAVRKQSMKKNSIVLFKDDLKETTDDTQLDRDKLKAILKKSSSDGGGGGGDEPAGCRLVLSSRALELLHKDTFVDVGDHVEELVLSENRLNQLNKKLFRPFKRLRTLDLSHNKLQSVLPETFAGGVGNTLQLLWLCDNQLDSLDESLFVDMHALVELHLSGNQLTTLATNTFAQLGNLGTLSLNSNQLESVDSRLFERLAQLRTLTLNQNKLSTLGVDTFASLINLEHLDLGENQLQVKLTNFNFLLFAFFFVVVCGLFFNLLIAK
jgi:Leucine-rich repeat (LRR) protein